MLLPTIEFIQSGGDGSSTDMTINYWQWLEAAYAFIGLSIGLGPLLITSFLFISLRQVLNYCHKAYRQTVILGLARDIRNGAYAMFLYAKMSTHDRLFAGGFVNVRITESHRAHPYKSSPSAI